MKVCVFAVAMLLSLASAPAWACAGKSKGAMSAAQQRQMSELIAGVKQRRTLANATKKTQEGEPSAPSRKSKTARLGR